ncbi:Fpg/Nei family DNA glycosylase [Streptomyces pristinaespiralis]|uniref:Formamidopyrimidine-DNA glycosylase n=2 Tax=Streptomyces pristinaespiralis TaxID=38300 RepID=A0A0M4DQA2_STRPR|nr:DNA-formamidopyrimidine glycosylase family protein [Streptomyces pristinaespiralis]ALC24905.1 formamidopyrimidine-DNA glycosylase [Streptomyces pristinaespiralis]QMU12804.1 Fpg/Nei family DNA glycosylase [Streptomyces pristinaespiralis]
MPELPDVEGFREVLDSCARGKRIERVEVHDAGVLHGVTVARLGRALQGRRFAEPARHGKWLLARTDGPTLMMHFGMTGQLVCCRAGDPPDPHDRVVLALGREELRFRDQRKLQGLWLAEDPDADVARILHGQGPDALSLDRAAFKDLLSRRRGRVKAALTDQSVLAGLGNLLADEILWRAGLRPTRRADRLDDAELGRLHSEMRRTLRSSVRAGRVPPRRSWLTGRRDDSDPTCPRCDGPLSRGRVGGRGTVWCPRCQPDGS